MLRHILILLTGLALVLVTSQSSQALVTTYSFSSPPDNISFSIGGTTTNGYPSQLLDTQTAVELPSGIRFNNQVNNTLFIDDNSLNLQSSSRMNGNIAWADARGNGPGDPPRFEIDFTSATAGVPIRIEYDFAMAESLLVVGALVFDTDGDSMHYTFPFTNYSFGGGSNNGTHGHATIVPMGAINNIARIEYSYGLEESGSLLQFGIDNLVIDTGQSADFSGDGAIDAIDLLSWQAAYGLGNGADADDDGDTDGADYRIWQIERSAALSIASVVIPEPTTSILIGTAVLCTGRVTRYRRQRIPA